MSDVQTNKIDDEKILSDEDVKINNDLDSKKNSSGKNDKKIIDTTNGKTNGQSKCPKCGSTDIGFDVDLGKLKCNFCRYEYSSDAANFINEEIDNLEGLQIGSGADDINSEADSIITLKCSSCGAEVVIDTNDSMTARCHWCRNTLSINEKIENGAIPDAVLPFSIKKEEAQQSIENFVGKRKFFAHPKFKEEFSTENIMGMYFPYMVIDMNAHADFSGQAEIEKRKYTVKVGDSEETRYDADLYWVERHFDVSINDLTVESSEEKLTDNKNKTNNIINAIMPFDTENCVCWDANYLRGFSSEKRDMDVEKLENFAKQQAKDIAVYKAKEDMQQYDRGTNWQNQNFDVKGQRWCAAYLPVWLYSYHEKKSNGKNLLHYVAVNGRTKETMGSVPIHQPKLLATSAIIEIIGIIVGILAFIFLGSKDKDSNNYVYFVTFLAGFVYYAYIYLRYRNSDARHKHESETEAKVRNMQRRDDYQDTRTGLHSTSIKGRNDSVVTGNFGMQNLKSLVNIKPQFDSRIK